MKSFGWAKTSFRVLSKVFVGADYAGRRVRMTLMHRWLMAPLGFWVQNDERDDEYEALEVF